MNILITWVVNFLVGIIGTLLLVSQIASGKSISAQGGEVGVGFKLDTFSIIIWAVVVLIYFFGAKKLWGKTAGGIVADKLTGKK